MVRHWWWLVGLVLVVGGLVLALVTRADPAAAGFGWVAYSPLDPGPVSGGAVLLVSRWQVLGAVVAVLGLLLVASGVGFRLGRSRG